MTAKEAAGIIGKVGAVVLGGLTVYVEIMDVKTEWGKVRYQVKPVEGSGSAWVETVRNITAKGGL